MPKKLRLDQLLVGRGLFPSREQARRAILAGEISVATRVADKPSELLDEQTAIAVKPTRKYVGRGALKLESALDHFDIDVHGKTALDIGSSTGGFTDCMLQRGAEKIYAVDVGYGQLDWKLRNDPRVIVLEKTNARCNDAFPRPEYPFTSRTLPAGTCVRGWITFSAPGGQRPTTIDYTPHGADARWTVPASVAPSGS